MSFEIYSEQFYKELDKKIEKVENENKDLPFLPKDEYLKQQKIISTTCAGAAIFGCQVITYQQVTP